MYKISLIYLRTFGLANMMNLQFVPASGFLGLIRLQNDAAIITAHSHNANTSTTTGLILQADESEMDAVKERLLYHYRKASSTGHDPLLLRTILVEMSLAVGVKRLDEIKQDVMDIEHSTGQHTWDNYRARDEEPKPDIELSRVAHGMRIQVAVVCRRIEVASIWVELLLESLALDRGSDTAGGGVDGKVMLLQWVRNIKTQAKMARLDGELIAKRVENQVGAVRTI